MSAQRATPDVDVTEILTADDKEMVDLLGQIESTPDAGKRRDLATR